MLTIFNKNPRAGKTPDPQRDPSELKQSSYGSRREPAYMSPPVPTPEKKHTQPKQELRQPAASPTTVIGKGLTFEGEAKGEGAIRVEGVLIGTINVKDEVIIGKGGKVKGNINSKIVTVLGRLEGNVNASKKITIDIDGTMIGDIVAPSVVVTEGTVYKGRIEMVSKENKSPAKPNVSDPKKSKQGSVKPGAAPPPGPPPKA